MYCNVYGSVFSGLYFEKHLKFIKLNEKFVPFTKMDLTYLLKVCIQSHAIKYLLNSSRWTKSRF